MSKEIILERYWLHKMQGVIPRLSFPTPGVNSEVNEGRNRHMIVVSEEVQTGIKKLVNDADMGRFCCYATAFSLLLARYSGEEDILVTTPELMIGDDHDPGNVTFLRTAVSSGAWLKDLLTTCKNSVAELYRYRSYKYENLLQRLGYVTQPQIKGLFQAGLVDTALQNVNKAIYDCDLVFIFSHKDGKTRITIDFHAKYGWAFIEQLSGHFINILQHMIAEVNIQVKDLRLLSDPQKEQLLVTYNDTRKEMDLTTVPHLFSAAAKAIPDSPALRYRDEVMSYRQLDDLSDRLCHFLITEKKIAKGDIIAVCLEASFGLVVSMLAVMKAGAVILPLVPADPAERLSFILSDSRAKLLITEDAFIHLLPETDHLFFKEIYLHVQHSAETRPQIPVNGCNDAYIIYTSGSTGRSKGTRLTHDNIVNMLCWFKDYFNFEPTDVLPQKTTIAFVDSIVELLLPLTVGRSGVFLRPFDAINQDAVQLAGWLKTIGATIVQFVPSVFESFYSAVGVSGLPAIKCLILSGEPLKKQYSFPFDVYNLYGCSECTASSTVHKLQKNIAAAITIGHPVYNTQVYILDKDLSLVPQYVGGDIYIGGRSLSNGYLHNEKLTGQRFVNNPYRKGELMYKTGDRGRWLDKNNIDFLGRADDQVKLRGMRIEPAEIEKLLTAYPGISRAFVVLYNNEGEDVLAAYLVHSQKPVLQELKAYLIKYLPDHMVPYYFVSLESIPLTATGKINKQLFPDPKSNHIIEEQVYLPPTNNIEHKLAGIWQEVLLRNEPVSITQDFVGMGGHSLKAIKIISRIEKEFNVQLSLKDFFRHATVKELSKLVAGGITANYGEIIPVTQMPHYELSHAQKRLWILSQVENMNDVYNISHAYQYKGLLSIPAMEKAFAALVQRHESLRTVFFSQEGSPRQKVLDYDPDVFHLKVTDLRSSENTITDWVKRETKKPFDLEKGPLIRLHLFHYQDEEYALSCTLHHIISDGWSMRLLIHELTILYNAYFANAGIPLQPLLIQYKDYSDWHNKLLNEDGRDKKYWLQKLAGDIPAIQLPIDMPRKNNRSYLGGMMRSVIDDELARRLQEFNKLHNVTMFVSLVTFVKTLLFKYSSQEDIIIGSPISGRSRQELEKQIGLYLNNLVLRDEVKAGDQFVSLLKKVRQTTFEAFDHQLYPYDKIIEDINPFTPPGRNPLYDVMIVMTVNEENEGRSGAKTEYKNIQGLQVEHTISKLDLTFFFSVEERLHVGIEYCADLFNKATIQKMHADLEQVIRYVLNNPGTTVGSIKESLTALDDKEAHAAFKNTLMGILDETF